METNLTEMTLRIYLAHIKIWPEATHELVVAESAKIARLIIDQTDESSVRAKLHNLQMDYDSLRVKYEAVICS